GIGEGLLWAVVEDVLLAVLVDAQRRLDLDDLTERIDLRPTIDRPLDNDAQAVAFPAILMAAVVVGRAVARMRHLDEVVAARHQIGADAAEMIEDLLIGEQAVEAVIERRDDVDRLRQGEAAHVAGRPADLDAVRLRTGAR